MRRLPVYLLLDTSGSMAGNPIRMLKAGVQALIDSFRADPYMIESAHLAVLAFGHEARIVCPLTSICDNLDQAIELEPAQGPTNLGSALRTAMTQITKEVIRTTVDQKGDYTPWLFIVTDGNPSDLQVLELNIPVLKSARYARVCVCPGSAKANHPLLTRLADEMLQLESYDLSIVMPFFRITS